MGLPAEDSPRLPSAFLRGRPHDAGRNAGRTVSVTPESSTILYTGDTFSVRETFFVPVHELVPWY